MSTWPEILKTEVLLNTVNYHHHGFYTQLLRVSHGCELTRNTKRAALREKNKSRST